MAEENTPAQLVVQRLSRSVPPINQPLYCFVFFSSFWGIALFVMPQMPKKIMNDKFWAYALPTNWGTVVNVLVYGIMALCFYVGLAYLARGIALCWPDYYRPFPDSVQRF